MENVKKYLSWGFLAVCVIIASFLIYNSFFKKSTAKLPAVNVEEVVPATGETSVPAAGSEPVRAKGSPDKLITAAIDITETKIDHSSLEVAPFTLVTFNNKSGKAVKIASEKFPGISLASGEKANQLFDRAGSYSYTITGLDASLTGAIIAK